MSSITTFSDAGPRFCITAVAHTTPGYESWCTCIRLSKLVQNAFSESPVNHRSNQNKLTTLHHKTHAQSNQKMYTQVNACKSNH